MDCASGRVGDHSFSRFGFIMRTDTHRLLNTLLLPQLLSVSVIIKIIKLIIVNNTNSYYYYYYYYYFYYS